MRAAPLLALLLAPFIGCATTRYTDTSRTATEQLLISNAVDQALDRVDFPQLAGRSVFIDDKYIECVDKAYVVGCVRHRVLAGGARLADKPEAADVVLEPRSGGVGTDKIQSFFGLPQLAIPGPWPINLPEIKLVSRETQSGTAKIGIVAYDARSRRAIGEGGLALAKSYDHGWTILGMGPYFHGEVRQEVALATGGAADSQEAARRAARRGYRTPEGALASVNLADERAAIVAAVPNVSGPPAGLPIGVIRSPPPSMPGPSNHQAPPAPNRGPWPASPAAAMGAAH